MPDKIFVDTNVWVYLYSLDQIKKKAIACNLLASQQDIIISTQVLNEFAHVMHRKFNQSWDTVRTMFQEIDALAQVVLIDKTTIGQAIQIASSHNFSYFDSLMIASAQMHQCSLLYTEDLHHGQSIEWSLKIINPFI